MIQLLKDYQEELIQAIRQIDEAQFEKAVELLLDAYHNDRQVFITGNGGSAGTANHFVCDFGKNAVQGAKRRFRIHSLCDNVEVLTALGNDIAFDQIFAFQLGNQMRPGDVLMVVSASGNSPDLVAACDYARQQGNPIIALSGFGGGKICDGAAASLITDMRSYERIEDLHLILLHMMVCWFKQNQHRL